LAKGLNTFFLFLLPNRPFGLLSFEAPRVSGLRLELLD
jgi:hypothetical protein